MPHATQQFTGNIHSVPASHFYPLVIYPLNVLDGVTSVARLVMYPSRGVAVGPHPYVKAIDFHHSMDNRMNSSCHFPLLMEGAHLWMGRGGVVASIALSFVDDGLPMQKEFQAMEITELLKTTKLRSNLHKLTVAANNDEIKVESWMFDQKVKDENEFLVGNKHPPTLGSIPQISLRIHGWLVKLGRTHDEEGQSAMNGRFIQGS